MSGECPISSKECRIAKLGLLCRCGPEGQAPRNDIIGGIGVCASLGRSQRRFLLQEKIVFWFLILVIGAAYNAGALAALTRT